MTMLIGMNLEDLPPPIHKDNAGQSVWVHLQGDIYLVTGVDRNGKRFRITTNTWQHACGINLWRGTKWLVRGKKRFKIQSVFN
jgi:hypothetical protein